ncbi:DUF1839 family protein [Reyranella sp. CPCC 100927]|uniref:DUF1839 family protein n=1 Tax=Reyranella sp. CPCC 100927 TaxID=2599616 RepID=UPI0011B671AA|nr:DUF1839 family protein [Reyranella sp. CPCC 100927]TWT15867.1 DUF1839 family protein [Reyranella sp. CPCC 100927]
MDDANGAGARLLPVDPADYRAHALHAPDRIWLETNCYIDVWVEVLHAFGLEPLAALSFTVEQDFEGDHFTFFKFPPEDLRALFGLQVQELAIFDTVEGHSVEQIRRGRMPLVEVDSYYLPDTRGTAYKQAHVKSTIGIGALDIAARRMNYFHNTSYHLVEGEDFDGLFRRLPAQQGQPDVLFPYVEFVKRDGQVLEGRALVEGALALMKDHLARRPAGVFTRFRAEFPRHLEMLASRPMDYFHLYAFNIMRQLGANFEMLGSHLQWLAGHGEAGLDEAIAACLQIAEGTKALQFQLARAVSRKKFGDYSVALDDLQRAHDLALGTLERRYGR